MYSPHLANITSGLLNPDTGNCAGVMGESRVLDMVLLSLGIAYFFSALVMLAAAWWLVTLCRFLRWFMVRYVLRRTLSLHS